MLPHNYAATSAHTTPAANIAYCNKSHDPIDLLQKLCLHFNCASSHLQISSKQS